MKKKNILKLLMLLVVLIFAIAIVPKKFQNDTFFDISLGRNILKRGIQLKESLVWHKGLNFPNPRWLFDVIVALIYKNAGFIGIYAFTVFVSCIQVTMYYLMVDRIVKKPFISALYTILFVKICEGQFTCRGQIISFLLFQIEFWILEEFINKKNKRYLVILAIIPFLIVNMHAAVYPMYFCIILPYIAEYILSMFNLRKNDDSKIVIEKIDSKIFKQLCIILVIGFLAGFCGVKGLGAHTYMFRTVKGVPEGLIAEMVHTHLFSFLYFCVMLYITIGILCFTKTKIRVSDCFYIVGFTYVAFHSIRGIYFFAFISSICIIRLIHNFFMTYDVDINRINNKIKVLLTSLVCVSIVLYSIGYYFEKISINYDDASDYPIDVANYILKNIDISKMRLYNGFNYGSYLEFRGIPTFMDSRAELYSSEFNNTDILLDFYNFEITGEYYGSFFEKYDFTHILMDNGSSQTDYISKDENWKLIYKNTGFSLFEKVN